MTSQGTAHGRFQRAIKRRHLNAAEMAARELGGLNLAEAPDLTLLMRETDRWGYERAAVRWLERFIEERGPTLAEIALATAALAEVGGTAMEACATFSGHAPLGGFDPAVDELPRQR
jgi:hypothetical protein